MPFGGYHRTRRRGGITLRSPEFVAAIADWGSSLPPDQFGSALAALGVLSADFNARGRLDILGDEDVAARLLNHLLGPDEGHPPRAVAWSLRPGVLGTHVLREALSSETLARAWSSVVDAEWPAPPRVRLEMQDDDYDLGTTAWFAHQISMSSARAAPHLASRSLGTATEWSWPLRIGFLVNQASRILRDEVLRSWPPWLQELVEIGEAEGPETEWDLLVVPDSLSGAIHRLRGTRHGVDAGCLVVLDGLGEAETSTTADVEKALREPLDPWAIGIVSVPAVGASAWLRDLVEELSHDRTLDVAMGWLGSRAQIPTLVVADPAPLAAMHVSRVAERYLDRMASANGGDVVELPREVAVTLGLDAGPMEREKLGEAVAEPGRYAHEITGATGVARMSRLSRRATVAEPRWIQGQVLPLSGPRRPVRQGLRPQRDYTLNVRIGPEDEEWLRASGAFPDDQLPADRKRHLLRVVFQVLGGSHRPVVGKVHLPPEGASDVCRFVFRTTASGRFRARIMVQFRNRVLQTAIVSAGIWADGRIRRISDRVSMSLESVLRPPAASLAGRSAFDAAFVHNHSPVGVEEATAISGDWVAQLRLTDVKAQSANIQTLLGRVAGDPQAYGALRDPATVQLLYALALQGRDLLTALFPRGLSGKLVRSGATRRIQIVAADPNAYLPLEFLYEYPPPNAQELCANAAPALRKGACDPAKFHEPVAADGSIPVVCPSGFLAMSAVIERHGPDTFVPELAQFDYGLRSEPVGDRDRLRGVAPALFAASDRVTEEGVASVVSALTAATGRPAQRVETWEDWVGAIAGVKPALLVLLSHTAKDEVALQAALEIAAAQQCPAGRFTQSYIRAVDVEPGPVVLLLGCDTAVPWLDYQSFVVRFRNLGAAVVIGTVATVPASHAARVASGLARQLKPRRAPDAAIGDVMLTARRRMLARGEVMALCLTSYGDAQWKLT